jgi:serine/threonine protein kinase
MFRLDLPPEQTADLASALEDVVSQQPGHPTIAAALAAGVEGKQAYFAQEYIAGDSLDAVIRQSGRPAIDATLVTLSRLAEALDRAAGEGIHHGALHLRDVLLEDGAPRLIDVGIAQALQHAGLRAPVRLPYSAPERVEDRPWGGPADIFALGAIAFELVTGRRIVGPGAPSVWAETVPGADVNALSDVFSRALAIEPGARFASASDLVDALRPILARTQTLASTVAVPSDAAIAEEAPPTLASWTDPKSAATVRDDAPLPSFLSESRDYERIDERDDDISAELPLIAGAGSAPMFEVAADDRPGFLKSRETSGDQDGHKGPFRDVAPPPLARPIEARDETTRSPLGDPTLSGPMWSAPADPVRERRPFLALIIALVVGVAGGFGWGYWTAWQAAQRETAATLVPSRPSSSPQASPESSPPQTSPESSPSPSPPPAQRVEEPNVVGEAKLPPPSRQTGRPAAATSEPPLDTRRPSAQNESRRAAAAAAVPATSAGRSQRAQPRTPAATTGSLLVDSRPVGAEVTVDGRAVGVTPVTIEELAPGEHRVVLQIPGFNLWATTAQVTAGSRTRVAASLERVQ